MFFCVVLKWVRMRIKARRRNFWSFLCSQNGLSWRQTRIKDHFWRLCEIPAAEFSYFTLTENFMSEKKPLWAGTSSIAADIISCPKSSNWWGDTFSSNFGKVKVASVWWNFAVNPMFLSVTLNCLLICWLKKKSSLFKSLKKILDQSHIELSATGSVFLFSVEYFMCLAHYKGPCCWTKRDFQMSKLCNIFSK